MKLNPLPTLEQKQYNKLNPHNYAGMILAILTSVVMSQSQGKNENQPDTCIVFPTYSTIENPQDGVGPIIAIHDCITGTVVQKLNISGIFDAPIRNK